MNLLFTVLVTFFAGMGAGLGTGFAGMSAAAVISPMLITFLHMDPYMAVGIALSSDVLASAVSAYTYHKNKNLDIKNGLIMMASVLAFTVVGSWVASRVPSATMGGFSVFMTFLLGVKFILSPGHDHQGSHAGGQPQKACRAVGGVRRAHWLYLRLYRRRRRHDDAAHPHQRAGLRAQDGRGHQRVHHDLHRPDRCGLPLCHRRRTGLGVWVLACCSPCCGPAIAAVFANKADPKTLNRATGIVLVVLGIVIMGFKLLT